MLRWLFRGVLSQGVIFVTCRRSFFLSFFRFSLLYSIRKLLLFSVEPPLCDKLAIFGRPR